MSFFFGVLIGFVLALIATYFSLKKFGLTIAHKSALKNKVKTVNPVEWLKD